MLKSEIIIKLQEKHKNLNLSDIEFITKLFIKKIINSLNKNHSVEIRGFGTLNKKINKEKYVRNPKTNEKIFKKSSFKVHFKIGKTLHKKLNPIPSNE